MGKLIVPSYLNHALALVSKQILGKYHKCQCSGIWTVSSKLELLQTCIAMTYKKNITTHFVVSCMLTKPHLLWKPKMPFSKSRPLHLPPLPPPPPPPKKKKKKNHEIRHFVWRRFSNNQMHFLYKQLVICSCDTETNLKTLSFCFREVLRDCFKRTKSIERHWHSWVLPSQHTMVKKCLKDTVMLFHLKTNYFCCCWFCCFTSQVNSYGHCGTVSSPNHTFSWAGLNKRLTSNSCTYFRL